MTDSVLTIEDLHLSFPIYRGEVHALNHVSLEIKRGDCRRSGRVGVGEVGYRHARHAPVAGRQLPNSSRSGDIAGRRCSDRIGKQLRQWRGAKVAMIFQEPMTALNPTRRIGKQMVEVIRQHQPLDMSRGAAKSDCPAGGDANPGRESGDGALSV